MVESDAAISVGPVFAFRFIMNAMAKNNYVYILTNRWNRILYVGVSGDLLNRIFQHREKFIQGFTSKYNVDKLVYFETYDDPETAIKREKQLKAGSRAKKIRLIERMNPNWEDLYCEIALLK